MQLVLLHTVMLLSLVSWTDAGLGSLSTWIKLDPPPRLGGIALVANYALLEGLTPIISQLINRVSL